MSVFWKSCRLYYIALLQQDCKTLLSKSVCRRFSIIKLFLKNLSELTESYMKLKVVDWKEASVEGHSCTTSGVYLEPYQTSMMKLLAVAYSQKRSIIDTWQSSKYSSTALFFDIFSISLLGYLNEYMNILFSSESVQLLCSCDVNQKCKIFYCFSNHLFYIDHGNTKFSYIYTIEMWKSSLWKTSKWNASLIYTIN